MVDDDYDFAKDPEVRAAIEAEREWLAGGKSERDRQAPPEPTTQPAPPTVLPSPNNPVPCSRELIAARFHHPDHPTLIQQGGQFYRWDRMCWPPFEDRDLKAVCYAFTENAEYLVEKDGTVEKRPWSPTQRKIADFIDATRAVTHITASVPSPSWLDGPRQAGGNYSALDMVACRNGLLHIPSRSLVPHTPLFYAHNSVPFDFDLEAREPVAWINFLREIWPDNDDGTLNENIRVLQEIFGYLVTGSTRQQKMFMLVGPRRGGKGTIARVLRAVLGGHNVAGPTLASLATNFGLSPLIGKSVAIISDARLGAKTDVSLVTERLLSISGEDTLTIDRKYMEPVTLQLPTRFVVLSNELPRLSDASGALASRFIILILTRSFYGKEDPDLTSKLTAELSGILNWALDGAESLNARGRFVVPQSSADAVRAMEDLSSPIGAFVRDNCRVGAQYSVSCDLLFREWKAWCELNGQKVGTKQVFGRDLHAAVPGLKTNQARTDGERYREYQGLGMKPQ